MSKKNLPLLFVIWILSFGITPTYAKANKVDLLIIRPKECITCNTEAVVNSLQQQFEGLSVSYLAYPGKKADNLVRSLAITVLPAYLLDKQIEKEKNFASLKTNLQMKGNFYMLKPQFSGLSYFINRKRIEGRLDLFISLYDENSGKLLDAIKEFNPNLHFLAIEQGNKFDAPAGNLEIEEDLRAVCVKKYYPEYFFQYVNCRSNFITSSWWEDCAINLDTNKIKTCAQGSEGTLLLRENTNLNKELQIMLGPTYLLDNQEVFSSKGVPSKEELKAIIKR